MTRTDDPSYAKRLGEGAARVRGANRLNSTKGTQHEIRNTET